MDEIQDTDPLELIENIKASIETLLNIKSEEQDEEIAQSEYTSEMYMEDGSQVVIHSWLSESVHLDMASADQSKRPSCKISFISPGPFDASYETQGGVRKTTNRQSEIGYASILTGKSVAKFTEYEKII